MKSLIFIFVVFFLVYLGQSMNHFKYTNSIIVSDFKDECSKLKDKAFFMTINKEKHRIDYPYYGFVMYRVAFTEICDFSMNDRIDVLIALAYFQERNASYVITTTKLNGMNKKYKPLLLLLATTIHTHDSLIKIRSTDVFLNKLDNAHRNIYLKIEGFAKKNLNKVQLKTKIRGYYGYITATNWFYGKYKNYYKNE